MKAWQEGIHYQVVKSSKYKTNQLMIKAILPYTVERATAWSLLCRMMEDGSDQIPSKAALEGHLANLYGASLSVGVQRKGQYLEWVLASQCVRSDLVEEPTLLKGWLQLIAELIFSQNSLVQETDLARTRFEREQAFLIKRIQRLKDDKSILAVQKLYQSLYQAQPDDALGGTGDEASVRAATLSQVRQAYQDLLRTASFYVAVNGYMEEADFMSWLSQWPLGGRKTDIHYLDNYLHLAPEERQLPATLQQEAVDGQQANLAMAFTFPEAKTLRDRILIQIANALFGGLPVSRLFSEIREKQSLAYSIQSTPDFHRSLILVRAGIGPQEVQHVQAEVEAQLRDLIENLVAGDFFEEVKLTLLSADVQSRDYQHLETDKCISQRLYPDFDLSTAYFESVVKSLTVDDVVACLKRWQLVGSFALIGGQHEAQL